MRWVVAVLLLGLLTSGKTEAQDGVIAGVADPSRARINYMLQCQGCHGPNGDGSGDVPALSNFVGQFLRVPGGREFLVQVPGSANADLNDQELAEVLNWLLVTLSKEQLPTDYAPFNAGEVGELRLKARNLVFGSLSAFFSL